MVPVLVLFAAVVVATAARAAALRHRYIAHIEYLQQELRDLGGEDRWNMRCTHCGRRMRDEASTRYSTATPSPSGRGWVERTHGVFHMDRPECAAAAAKVEDAW